MTLYINKGIHTIDAPALNNLVGDSMADHELEVMDAGRKSQPPSSVDLKVVLEMYTKNVCRIQVGYGGEGDTQRNQFFK